MAQPRDFVVRTGGELSLKARDRIVKHLSPDVCVGMVSACALEVQLTRRFDSIHFFRTPSHPTHPPQQQRDHQHLINRDELKKPLPLDLEY